MQRSVVNPLLLILAIAALAGAAWLYVKNQNLERDLSAAVTARSIGKSDAQAANGRASELESAKTKAERLLAEVGDQLKAAQSAKDAAAQALKQAQDQLVTQKDADEAKLKAVSDELTLTRAEKEKAEVAAAEAKKETAEQAAPLAPVPAPQNPAPTAQGP